MKNPEENKLLNAEELINQLNKKLRFDKAKKAVNNLKQLIQKDEHLIENLFRLKSYHSMKNELKKHSEFKAFLEFLAQKEPQGLFSLLALPFLTFEDLKNKITKETLNITKDGKNVIHYFIDRKPSLKKFNTLCELLTYHKVSIEKKLSEKTSFGSLTPFDLALMTNNDFEFLEALLKAGAPIRNETITFFFSPSDTNNELTFKKFSWLVEKQPNIINLIFDHEKTQEINILCKLLLQCGPHMDERIRNIASFLIEKQPQLSIKFFTTMLDKTEVLKNAIIILAERGEWELVQLILKQNNISSGDKICELMTDNLGYNPLIAEIITFSSTGQKNEKLFLEKIKKLIDLCPTFLTSRSIHNKSISSITPFNFAILHDLSTLLETLQENWKKHFGEKELSRKNFLIRSIENEWVHPCYVKYLNNSDQKQYVTLSSTDFSSGLINEGYYEKTEEGSIQVFPFSFYMLSKEILPNKFQLDQYNLHAKIESPETTLFLIHAAIASNSVPLIQNFLTLFKEQTLEYKFELRLNPKDDKKEFSIDLVFDITPIKGESYSLKKSIYQVINFNCDISSMRHAVKKIIKRLDPIIGNANKHINETAQLLNAFNLDKNSLEQLMRLENKINQEKKLGEQKQQLEQTTSSSYHPEFFSPDNEQKNISGHRNLKNLGYSNEKIKELKKTPHHQNEKNSSPVPKEDSDKNLKEKKTETHVFKCTLNGNEYRFETEYLVENKSNEKNKTTGLIQVPEICNLENYKTTIGSKNISFNNRDITFTGSYCNVDFKFQNDKEERHFAFLKIKCQGSAPRALLLSIPGFFYNSESKQWDTAELLVMVDYSAEGYHKQPPKPVKIHEEQIEKYRIYTEKELLMNNR